MVSRLALFAAVAAIALAAISCSGRAPSETTAKSPSDAALAVAKALAKGDAQGAAAYWAYDSEARRQNEDWDSFPAGQRSQIKAKLRAEKAEELRGLASTFGNAKGEMKARAQDLTVEVLDDQGVIARMTCAKAVAGGYQVESISTGSGAR